MDILHESMEMDALLARNRRKPIELIHEKALSTPDRAPQIDAADARWPAQHSQQWPILRFVRFEFRREPLKTGADVLLRGV